MVCIPCGKTFSHLIHVAQLLTGSTIPYPNTEYHQGYLCHGTPCPIMGLLHALIDLCAGFGVLSQGIAAGFEVAVPRMMELYAKVSDAPQLRGDFGESRVLYEIWQKAGGASALSSGFSCQPYSRLGDGKSGNDIRSNCLSKTLAAAFFLQTQLVVLECVAPAGQDGFVKAELEHFMRTTGFSCSQVELRLDHAWPCRRHQAWWILVSPELGPIDMSTWLVLKSIAEVQQVIPSIRLWTDED